MEISVYHFFVFTFQLFLLGFFGVLSTRFNLLYMLLCIEVMILASVLTFVVSAVVFQSVVGQVSALLILVVVAAESALGLSLLILLYKLRGTISYTFINLIKG